jgi:hypothetical protein
MFRNLNRNEAIALIRVLNSGYSKSIAFCREVNKTKRSDGTWADAGSANKVLNSQAAMRQELTSLAWNVREQVA